MTGQKLQNNLAKLEEQLKAGQKLQNKLSKFEEQLRLHK